MIENKEKKLKTNETRYKFSKKIFKKINQKLSKIKCKKLKKNNF